MKRFLALLGLFCFIGVASASELPAPPVGGEWTSKPSSEYDGLFYYTAKIPQSGGAWISIPAKSPETGATLWGKVTLDDGSSVVVSFSVDAIVRDADGNIIPGATMPRPEPLSGHSIVSTGLKGDM